ncbi:tripartite motif-containing protein 16-like [Labrus mixtus]|uniref:tripartite motif-containing protein 16-like n=1 Tax=Labrus mixtus TaxID=508554 RepID=UPI0029C06182|nr:tripartite motif-containing protein 16-like [Labrus mixtus]
MDCIRSYKGRGECVCHVCVTQRELEVSPADMQQDIQRRKRSVQVLQLAVENINLSADEAGERSDEVTDLIRHVDKIFPLNDSAVLPSSKMCPLGFFEDVTATVSDTKDGPQDIPADFGTNTDPPQTQVNDSSSNLTTEPKTRAEFLQYARDITLDPNTVNTQLLLSEGNRKATLMTREEQPYPSHPDRFIRWRQALSKESLTGRCYWEVEWRMKRVNLAVSYRDISREGSMNECAFGFNNESWLLECNCSNSYKFIHNRAKTLISGPLASRIGVYLDHRAGILSFYSISKTMTLLHRVQTTFTQPLHAGLWFSGYNGASAEFCQLT